MVNIKKGQYTIIGEQVAFGENVTVGHHTIIEDGVTIGKNVKIGSHTIIYAGTVIGDHSIVQDHVVIGKQPTRAKASILPDLSQLPPATIGNSVTVGTGAILYANCTISDDVFIADLATIRERVSIGEATIVGRGVAIENNCTVGKRCKLETNSYITAYSELGDFVFIAPGVVTTNDNYMGRSKERLDKFKGITVKTGGRIGANTTVLPGRIIHEDGAVAAGSIVTKDVKKESLVMGVPAKHFSNVDEKQLLRNQEK